MLQQFWPDNVQIIQSYMIFAIYSNDDNDSKYSNDRHYFFLVIVSGQKKELFNENNK